MLTSRRRSRGSARQLFGAWLAVVWALGLQSESAQAAQALSIGLPERASTGSFRSVVVGRIDGDEMWVVGDQVPLRRDGGASSVSGGSAPASGAAGDAGKAGTPILPRARVGGSAGAVFNVQDAELKNCTETRRFRDLSFLIATLKDVVTAVDIVHSSAGEICAAAIASKLRQIGILGVSERVGTPAVGAVSVVLTMMQTAPLASAPTSTTGPAAPAAPVVPLPSSATSGDAYSVFVDGRALQVQDDGWFAVELVRTDPVEIEVRAGSRVTARRTVMPYFLKIGENPAYRSTRFELVFLESDVAPKPIVKVLDMTDPAFQARFQVSLPIVLKGAIGYTLLTPLPDEQVRDRPTVDLSVRSYPVWNDIFITANGILSLKSGSKIPWTLLGFAFLSKDLFFVRDNLSISVGLGARVFKAKVESSEATYVADPAEPRTVGKSVIIPESVLGPAIQTGILYKSGLVTSELNLNVTPFKLAGSDLITTVNGSLTMGYQMSPNDTLILSAVRHDVRYPTVAGIVKVVASSATIGYQRDLY